MTGSTGEYNAQRQSSRCTDNRIYHRVTSQWFNINVGVLVTPAIVPLCSPVERSNISSPPSIFAPSRRGLSSEVALRLQMRLGDSRVPIFFPVFKSNSQIIWLGSSHL